MARRRYHRRSRREHNYVWQAFQLRHEISLSGSGYLSANLGQVIPGIPVAKADGTGYDMDPFDYEITLKRMRGHVIHQGSGSTSGDDKNIPINIAMFKVPAAFKNAIETPDLFAVEDEGDDYPLFYSHFCNPSPTNALEAAHVIDSKAQRKFEPGDAMRFAASLWRNSTFSTNSKIETLINVRVLWELRR